jgi:hypothetical protein
MDVFVDIEQCDYTEDRVINGILHYWQVDKFLPYSLEELTEMYMDEVDFFDDYVNRTYGKHLN